jgi:hypothetical protein
MNHRNSTLRTVGVGSGVVLTLVRGSAGPGRGPAAKQHHHLSRHKLGQPYLQNSVNENSIVKPNRQPSGHGMHTGPIHPLQGWGDIIPSFSYTNDHGGTSIYPRTQLEHRWPGDLERRLFR